MHMRKPIAALALLTCSFWPGAASATFVNWSLGVQNLTAGDLTFSFLFAGPAAPIFGPVDTRLSYGMAVADGGRNGASVGIGSGAPALVQGQLAQGGGPLTTVAAAGTAESFAGEGGTAGDVKIAIAPVSNFTSAPLTFDFLFGSPVALTDRTLVQSTLVRAFADGDAPDGGSVAKAILPSVMQTRLDDAGNTIATVDLGADTLFPPDAGAFGPESASTVAECAAGCDMLQNELNFVLSPEDVAAFIMRTELGGSELTGPVAWTTTASDDATFDCGVIGCLQAWAYVNFVLSAGDSAVFAGRFDVESAAVPVPEPGTISLLGLGLTALGVMRRRRAGKASEQ